MTLSGAANCTIADLAGEILMTSHEKTNPTPDADASGAQSSEQTNETTTDQTTDQTTQQSGESTTGESAQSKALIDELNHLAVKFSEAVEVAWKSEQRKQLEEDLRTGVTSIAGSLEEQLRQFSKREETRQFINRAENVADKVRSNKVSQELAGTLAQGLRSLSQKLDKLAQEMREREEAQHRKASEQGAQTGQSGDSIINDDDTVTDIGKQDIPIDYPKP
jgi:septal ring factor EnvC (AmiA/AmiB activator)